MEIKFRLAHFPGLVRDVASIAAHIECGMATPLLGYVQSFFVTIEAEILALVPRRGLEQLILIVAGMRVVTLDAVSHSGRMHRPFNSGCIFVRVATEAQRLRSRSDELDAGYVFIDPNFVTAQASRGNGGVDRLTLRFVLMALQALLGVNILV